MELYRKLLFWIVQNYLYNPNLRVLKDSLRLGADSTAVFSKFFHAYGITPMGMIKDRRMKYACKQLQHTQETIPMIADALHCRTVEHFEAEFLEGMGVTPRAYRMKSQKSKKVLND